MNSIIRLENCPIILKDVFKLRAHIWRQLSGDSLLFGDEWSDEFDARALHWVAHVNGRLAAAARMSVHEHPEDIADSHIFGRLNLSLASPIASFNRLVVHADFRGMGISRELDARRLATARQLECRTVTANVSKLSGPKRLHALQKLGFEQVAPQYSVRDWDGDWVTPLVLSMSTEKPTPRA